MDKMRPRRRYNRRNNTNYCKGVFDFTVFVIAVAALVISIIRYTNLPVVESLKVIEASDLVCNATNTLSLECIPPVSVAKVTCDANDALSTDCLPDTGVMPGTYVQATLVVDDKGRVVGAQSSIGNGTTSNGTFVTVLDTLVVYVDGEGGLDSNDGFTPAYPKRTMDSAVQAFSQAVARACEIRILSFVDLGANPVLSFFPATFACQELKVSGVRINVTTDTVASSGLIEPHGRRFTRLNGVTGGYPVNAYECAFVYNVNTGVTYAVDSNEASSSEVAFNCCVFANGATIEYFTVSNQIRWSGNLVISAPDHVDFEHLVFSAQSSGSMFTTNTPEISRFIGCRFEFLDAVNQLSGNNIRLEGGIIKGMGSGDMMPCATFRSVIIVGTVVTVPEGCTATFSGLKVQMPNPDTDVFTLKAAQITQSSLLVIGSLNLLQQTNLWSQGTEIRTNAPIPLLIDGQSLFIDYSVRILTGDRVVITGGSHLDIRGDGAQPVLLTRTVEVLDGSSIRIGVLTQNINRIITGAFIIADGSRVLMDSFRWDYNGTMPAVSLRNGGEWYNTQSSVISGAYVLGTGPGVPVFDVKNGSRTFQVIGSGVSNRNYAGNVLQCGTNPISAGTVDEFDLSTGCFCA